MSKPLTNKLAEELHKPVNNKFQKRKVIAYAINDIWGADLVDMSEWKDANDGYTFLLTVIDVFSKYAFAIPLKNKSAESVVSAFEKIHKNYGSLPKKLWTDSGSEFYNSKLKVFMKKNSIEIYSTFGDHKSAVVERFNRTLKDLMWKYFTANNTRKYIDILDTLIKNYNNKKHSTIKMSPNEALKNEDKVYKTYFKNDEIIDPLIPKFNVDDYVRISRIKGIFEKGYLPNWTRAVYQVVKVLNTDPITYTLKEEDDTVLQGAFYENEMQLTSKPEFFEIEKVLKTRVVKGKKEYFVKFLGYDDKYNSWVDNTKPT